MVTVEGDVAIINAFNVYRRDVWDCHGIDGIDGIDGIASWR